MNDDIIYYSRLAISVVYRGVIVYGLLVLYFEILKALNLYIQKNTKKTIKKKKITKKKGVKNERINL